jgi:hypothetical protein
LAARQGSQLVVATHSEVIIDSVDPRELCVMYGTPRMLADTEERALLGRGLGFLTNTDIVLAQDAPGILYVEGHTDLEILREWARILRHPAHDTLTRRLFWKPLVWELRHAGAGIKAADHYSTLGLVRKDLPGLLLMDGDDNPNVLETPITGQGLQRLRWRRYEIESYLVHPAALSRFAERILGGPDHAGLGLRDLRRHFEENYPPAFLKDPHQDPAYLVGTKARTLLLPPALAAAGILGLPYRRFHEIAEVMLPEEIHPEVTEKLDLLQKAFGL